MMYIRDKIERTQARGWGVILITLRLVHAMVCQGGLSWRTLPRPCVSQFALIEAAGLWWKVRSLKTGEVGLVPSNYVEKVTPVNI